MKRLARVAAAVLLTLSGPAVAAAVAYDRLNQDWWTSAANTPGAAAPAPVRPTPEPVPAPSPQGAPEPPPDTRHPFELGDCVTPAATRTACTSGALRVVGSIHTRTGQPCRDVPETTHVQRTGAYTLCLAAL